MLVFEFITGGGFSGIDLPESLAQEGEMMLEQLLHELSELSSLQIMILLDVRFKNLRLPQGIAITWLSNQHNIYQVLAEVIAQADAVWPIAPENHSELEKISGLIESAGKILLNSPTQAVSLCTDKLKTSQVLADKNIAVVESFALDAFEFDPVQQWVVKPRDGVGCQQTYLISEPVELQRHVDVINNKSAYIIQPYIKGDALSLSCLFKAGKAWLICCNRQQISMLQGCFQLTACEVNIMINKLDLFQSLINGIAEAIPMLWGYVGIDIILTEKEQTFVIEINPRLTTSYVGIDDAMGINIAKQIINLQKTDPEILASKNKSVTVTI